MIDILTDTPQTKLMQIAGRVRQRRTTLRMTQASLAMRADIPLPTYRVFEKSGKISLMGLLKIGMALNCLEDFDRLFANQEYASLDDMLNAQTATKQIIKKWLVHVVSAAGLLRADYRIPCMDYRHLFALTMRLTHSMEEVWQLYRLMCFNVLIGNRDDHARNFSFIYTDGWHLSPAYDRLPCGIEGDYHTTTVCDNPLPTKADVLALAKEQGLNVQRAEAIWEEMEHHPQVR